MSGKAPRPTPDAMTDLRRQAEARLAATRTSVATMRPEDAQTLVHDFQVHQIELQMQNEELRRVQVELADARDRYFDLYEFAPVAYLTVDVGNVIREANLTASTLLAVERSRLIGTSLVTWAAPEHRGVCHSHLRAAQGAPGKQWCELTLRRGKGSSFFGRLEIVPITGSAEFAGGCRVTISDITSLRQTELALQQLNEELEARVAERTVELAKANAYNRSLIEASVDPLATIGPDGKITDVNAAAEAATGRTREELIGTDFSDYFTQPEKARAAYQQVFREGCVRDYALDIRHREGGTTPVLYNASLYRDERGKVIGVFAAARDITERRTAEEEMRRIRGELGYVDRVARLGELTASLAHELNQPLAAILSNAQAARRFLASDPPDLDQLREILDDIIQDDKRAGSVIHRLRLMLQKGKQEPETFQINDAIREVVQLLHSEAVGRNAALAVDLAAGLPAVRAGRVEVQQVLVNLLINALDAVQDVPPDRREILVRTQPDQDTVVVAVRDHGCGLPLADFHSIFEPFFTTKPTGLGMGLAICRRMIQAHGGRIWAANNDGAGATLAFCLPFTPADKEPCDG